MSSRNPFLKTKITITIGSSVASAIDKIAKSKKSPRSHVMEDILREGLLHAKKRAIEKDVEAYYMSLTEKEKKEDKEWAQAAAESAKGIWDD